MFCSVHLPVIHNDRNYTVASIQIFFEGGGDFFHSQGEGRKPRAGEGFLGSLPTSQRVWESAIGSPIGVQGGAPENLKNLKFGAT